MQTRRFKAAALIVTLEVFSFGCASPLGITDEFEEGFFQSGNIELHYVIDLPERSGPFPAVVFGHGSGEKTVRDYEAFAQRAIDRGIAILRYDKRGTGESGGTHVKSGDPAVNDFIPTLAGDMAAAAALLASHPDVDPLRVGLMGESQAGWVMPMAAVLEPDVRFVVALSGPTLPLAQVGAFETLAADAESGLDQLADQVADVEGGFDPRPWLRDLDVRGLWIFGGQDRHVPTKTSVEQLEELVNTLGKDFTTVIYANGDHGLRDDDSGDPIDYWRDLMVWFDATVGR